MVYLPTDSTKHDTNSITLQGVRAYTEDAVLDTTYPEWLLYLSLQVYVISLPTHIKNNTVSCQSMSNRINSIIRCKKNPDA